MFLFQWIKRQINGNRIEKHELRRSFMANDQMKGVFAKAIDVDWIPRYIIEIKLVKLFYSIETDFDKINETLENYNNSLKIKTKN
jgi:hypothetical protein